MGISQGSPYPDVIETNVQLEPVGCPVSNTSCIGEVLDAIESPDENKTQASKTSLDMARSPSETKSSMFEVDLLREGPSTTEMVRRQGILFFSVDLMVWILSQKSLLY